jgi:hypothetical protein
MNAGVRFLIGVRYFYLPHIIQTGSGAQPASYPLGTGCSFPDGKAAEGVKLATHAVA